MKLKEKETQKITHNLHEALKLHSQDIIEQISSDIRKIQINLNNVIESLENFKTFIKRFDDPNYYNN